MDTDEKLEMGRGGDREKVGGAERPGSVPTADRGNEYNSEPGTSTTADRGNENNERLHTIWRPAMSTLLRLLVSWGYRPVKWTVRW